MIPWYSYPDETTLNKLLERPKKQSLVLQQEVKAVIDRVAADGDAALYGYAQQFDGCNLTDLEIDHKQLETAGEQLDGQLKAAIDRAKGNVEKFHTAQMPAAERVETEPGIICWREIRPIEKVGIYVPGGTAPLFSTVLMLAVPARIAGCSQIVLATPPGSDGSVPPAILYAAYISGVTKVIVSGGAQAIAALALGTESVPKVDKIFGPGNQYVTMAKQLVSVEYAAIDMPAGPSEVLVIADRQADPALVASDLLSQAEHGTDSQSILLTDSEQLAGQVQHHIERQLDRLPRRMLAVQSLAHSAVIVVEDLDKAFDISNSYAPEHLILHLEDAQEYTEMIRNAGSVFVGRWTPESAGDYASGTNHTLPTSGWARSYSGVSLDSYLRKITFQKISADALESLGPTIETMAAAEGLDAHKEAVSLRLERIKDMKETSQS
jgi:histidinol dehydrogenase